MFFQPYDFRKRNVYESHTVANEVCEGLGACEGSRRKIFGNLLLGGSYSIFVEDEAPRRALWSPGIER